MTIGARARWLSGGGGWLRESGNITLGRERLSLAERRGRIVLVQKQELSKSQKQKA